MKLLKQLIGLICSVAMVLSLCGGAYASDQTSNENHAYDTSQASAEQFIKAEINRIAAEESECLWTNETVLGTPVVLYDAYDDCNGYVFKLYTDGSETGYIQINCFDGKFKVYCYSFTGIPAYEGLSNTCEKQLADSKNGRLYFFGNMTYCVKAKDDTFRAIDAVEGISIETARTYYDALRNAIKEKVSEQDEESCKKECNDSYYVPQTRAFTLVTTNDFSNLYATRPNGTQQRVTEHCSPTAATNIMRYFRSTGASPLSTSVSNTTIFMEMYYAMDTNAIRTSNIIQATGTLRSNIKPGISSFCAGRCCPPATIGRVLSVTLSGIKNHINNGELLLMSLDDFPSQYAKHSVVLFGYSGSSLKISTGWDTSYHYYSYANLTIAQYVYVGY